LFPLAGARLWPELPLLQGAILVLALFFVILNLLVDIASPCMSGITI
jgi:ABC-type dipeptide/oligopeptide/nickel transport system permease component